MTPELIFLTFLVYPPPLKKLTIYTIYICKLKCAYNSLHCTNEDVAVLEAGIEVKLMSLSPSRAYQELMLLTQLCSLNSILI